MKIIQNNIQFKNTLENEFKSSLSPLLLTGKNSYKKNFYRSTIDFLVREYNVNHIKLSGNPKKNNISTKKIDKIITIGGGSIIDSGKLIKYYSNENIELVCFPTTAGSGSESTNFAVEYVDNKKFSRVSDKLYFDKIYLIPECLQNEITSSVLDSFCQSVESLWSVNSNANSREFSFKAIKLLVEVFEELNSLENFNYQIKEKLTLASYFSGKAINISKTNAPHAFSYYLTSIHKIPHGYAVALLFPFFFERNKSTLISLVKNNLNIDISKIENNILKNFKNFIPRSELLKLNELNFSSFFKYVNMERLGNYPGEIRYDEFESYLKKIK